MNIIRKLQMEKAGLEAEVQALKEGISDLKSYLNSAKFYLDTTVQCADVILRLRETESAAPGKREEKEFEFQRALEGGK